MSGISIITMLAYDFRYSYVAIRSYYDIADEIILGLDADRLSWSQLPFSIDFDEMKAFIADIDTKKKIRIVEGNFHSQDHPMKNDTLERSILSREAQPGNWVVQIDADEMLLNATEFRTWLLTKNPAHNCVYARWITIFKTFGNKVLAIDPPGEEVPVATFARGQFTIARATAQPGIMSPLQLLHFSWGRTPEELKKKLTNWSHAQDFDVESFFRPWDSVTLENYQQIKNFHPLHGPTWQGLKLSTIGFAPAAPYRPAVSGSGGVGGSGG